MPMVVHKNLTLDDSHADIARVYADIAARDADTAFNTASTNINKNVRVDSPLSVYKLMSVGPTVFIELSQASGVEANGVLTDNFMIKGDGTNVLQRASSNGTDGIFVNETNDTLSIRPQSAGTQTNFAQLSDIGTVLSQIQTDTSISPVRVTMQILNDLFFAVGQNIQMAATSNLLQTAGGTFILQGGIGGEVALTRLAGTDQNPVVRIENVGTNPGKTSFLVGNRNPVGNVIGAPANLYFRENGTDSRVYIHKGISAENVNWLELESTPERVAFAVDTTTDVLGQGFQIYACTNTSAVRTITISTQTILLGTPALPHRFTIKDETSNAGIFPINIITESGLIDGNTMASIETDDGSFMFYVDGTNTFVEADHFTPRDAVVFTGNSFDVNPQAVDPQSSFFSADGKKVFILDRSTNRVFEYTVSISFDIGSTVTFTGNFFDFTTEETSPVTISFNTDGTRMFMAGQVNDTFFQYSLSIGFDLGSTVALIAGTHNVGTEDNNPTSIEWNPAGTKFFMVGRATNSVYEYTVSSSFDLNSTVTYTGNSFSVAAQDAAPESVRFSPDGKRFFISATIANVVNEYSLTTPFSLASGVAFTGNSFDYTNEGTVAISVAFKPSGTKMYLLFAAGAGVRRFFEYDVFPNFSME